MDHETVVRDKMTEKYLLNELDGDARNQFEEHFFDCPDCALDVRAAAELLAESKVILAEASEEARVRVPPPNPNPDAGIRFAWLRPAFALPLIVLLAVIGYQNLVTVPRLQTALRQPSVLPWASVNIGTWGAEGTPRIIVPQGRSFLLFVRIPPDRAYARYTADLYNPYGKLEWSLTIPVPSAEAASQQDQWPVQIPGVNRQPGNYTLAVHGVTASGDSKDVGRASFQLQIQN